MTQTRIIVIQTAFLGDLLLCIPTLNNIKRIFKDCHITLICRKGTSDLMRELRVADEVFEVDKKSKQSLAELDQFIKNKKFEILFCPHQSFRSALLSFRIDSNIKVGFKNLWNFFAFNKKIKKNMRLPDALRQLSLLSDYDESVSSAIEEYTAQRNKFGKLAIDSLKNRLFVPPIANMGLRSTILSNPMYVSILKKFNIPVGAIFVAPGSVWNTKRWTKEGFIQLIQKLDKHKVVLIGSPDEKELCDSIEAQCPGIHNIAGKPKLFELLVLLTTGSALVCNDSGAMHLGSVSEIPTVSIFGPTVLEIGYQPWQDRSLVVEKKDLSCRPCGLHGHNKCPIGTHECMKAISSSEVQKALESLLN